MTTPEYPENSIQWNIRHSKGKRFSATVYMNSELVQAIEDYKASTETTSTSDAIGNLIEMGLHTLAEIEAQPMPGDAPTEPEPDGGKRPWWRTLV